MQTKSSSKHTIREATLQDLPRIGLVAAAGFYHSPVFQFQRPYHGVYPWDTFVSYTQEYREAIISPNRKVFVLETKPSFPEQDFVYEALKHSVSLPECLQIQNTNVIVGVASMSWPPEESEERRPNQLSRQKVTPQNLRQPVR